MKAGQKIGLWFKEHWYYLLMALGAIAAVVFFFVLKPKPADLARRRGKDTPIEGEPTFLEKAQANAESAGLEYEIRDKIARENANEKIEHLDEVMKEPDPVKRRDTLADMLSSW